MFQHHSTQFKTVECLGAKQAQVGTSKASTNINKKMSDPRKIYDLRPDQLEVLEWKAARRLKLRNELFIQIGDPKRSAEDTIVRI